MSPNVLGESVQTELNTFFPFDPYKLPRSGAYIESVYREWASVAIDDDEDNDEDYDEDEDATSEEPPPSSLYEGVSSSSSIPFASSPKHDTAADQLGASFGGMSISPVLAPISVSLSSVMSVS
jgi:RNA polymerase I-specific transcription initiation factor RRN3